jgi:broad specificity phosphatase PhoE
VREAILARHAESEFSFRGAVNGEPGVACPLTPRGREQARRLRAALADTEVDLCVTSEFERVRETADIALEGRDVPRLVLPELNDIRFGEFEGRQLTDYRAWARAHGPTIEAPGGGESRAVTVARYVEAYRTIVARPEPTILVVAHGLPIRYALDAAAGRDPAPAVEQVPYAEPHTLTAAALRQAIERLSAWTRAPRFA